MARIVVALGGNALLKRGEALTASNQRANARTAAEALAPLCAEHEVVITHGNGPQVGLLALQELAYPGEDSPLDVLGAETEGAIGYMIEQEDVGYINQILASDADDATKKAEIEKLLAEK